MSSELVTKQTTDLDFHGKRDLDVNELVELKILASERSCSQEKIAVRRLEARGRQQYP
jgi:hypothetical protein